MQRIKEQITLGSYVCTRSLSSLEVQHQPPSRLPAVISYKLSSQLPSPAVITAATTAAITSCHHCHPRVLTEPVDRVRDLPRNVALARQEQHRRVVDEQRLLLGRAELRLQRRLQTHLLALGNVKRAMCYVLKALLLAKLEAFLCKLHVSKLTNVVYSALEDVNTT